MDTRKMRRYFPTVILVSAIMCAIVVTGDDVCINCDWGEWTSCSRSCGPGTRSRTSTGANPVEDEENCFLNHCKTLTEMSVFQQLVEDSYSRFAVPRDVTGTVTITHELSLNRILQLDKERQILTIDAWQKWIWRDPRLKDLMSTTDLERLVVPKEHVWVPDIILYNSARYPVILQHVNVAVTRDGTVTYVPPGHVESFCHVDDANTPVDIVSCTLMFGSWMYESDSVVLEPANDGASLALFSGDFNRNWELVETDTEVFNLNGYSVLVYTLKLKYTMGPKNAKKR